MKRPQPALIEDGGHGCGMWMGWDGMAVNLAVAAQRQRLRWRAAAAMEGQDQHYEYMYWYCTLYNIRGN
jgi:hypothetical protein